MPKSASPRACRPRRGARVCRSIPGANRRGTRRAAAGRRSSRSTSRSRICNRSGHRSARGSRSRSRWSIAASARRHASSRSRSSIRSASVASYDAIVIGAGHNSLVCAAYLARAGRKVLVLERRERIGGAAVTEEVFPGFRFSVFSYVVSLLRPEIIRDLELPKHGLHILPLESTLTPLENDYLAQWNDHDQNRRELARHSLRDAEAYDEFGTMLHQMARAIKPLLAMAPPDPGSLSFGELAGMRRL